MEPISLLHPYPSVRKNSFVSYGGSQMFSENKNTRKCGCGPVAALDLLIYLHRYHTPIKYIGFDALESEGAIELGQFNELLDRLIRRFLPLIPTRGINAVTMAAGLNAFFIRCRLPYRVSRCVLSAPMWDRAEDMLRRDIPVIFSVGVNFPAVWGKERLKLYSRMPDGKAIPVSSVKGHYMTLTALDSEWMTVSSWGRKYYISRCEYTEYMRKYSSCVLCNILYIK